MPRPARQLAEIHTMTHETAQRMSLALRNLEQLRPSGFPSTTPGNGSTGGGTVTARSRVETIALAPVDHAQRDHSDITRHANLSGAHGTEAVLCATGQVAIQPADNAGPRLWNMHAYRCAVLLLRTGWTGRPMQGWGGWYHNAQRTWELAHRWAFTPTTPAKAPDWDLLAIDLTDQWCRSCLRVGAKEPRDRGELCWWCRQFNGAEGFMPPAELVEARTSGRRITDAMVEPHRRAHRQRVGKKSAGSR